MVKRLCCMFLFIIIISCTRESKSNREIQISENIPVKSKSAEKKEVVKEEKKPAEKKIINIPSDFSKKTDIVITDEGNEERITIGKAKLSDINPSVELTKDKTASYLIQLKKFSPDYIDYLKKKGCEVGYYIPANTLIIKTDKMSGSVKDLKNIELITPYEPFMKISKSDGDIDKIKKAKISLWEAEYTNWFYSYCASNNIKILSSAGKEFIIEGAGAPVKPILFEENILRVEKYRDPQVFSFSANQIGEVVASGWDANMPDDYQNPVNVSVYDVGIDRTHSDLGGTVKNVYETAGDNNEGEFVSHGAHVAGIIGGRGNNSGGNIRGINPASEIIFYSMGDDLKGLMIPPSMENLFNISLGSRSYIANLSWGTYDEDLEGRYLSISRDIDDFVYNHPELIVITAVGNNGRSIASPATAKNVISVGALDGSLIAQYSGINGCSDGRTKPDLAVQGSGIESLGLNNSYTVLSGTSQATAIVSGLVSKLYPIIKTKFGLNPTHSIIKAFLIANTTGSEPAYDTGFGKLFFDTSIDTNHFLPAHFDSDLKNSGLKFSARKGDTLTAVLCWTEPPAFEASYLDLINDYDIVVKTPSGKEIRINDRKNNVEKIVIDGAEEGEYTARFETAFAPLKINDISIVIKSRMGFNTGKNETNDIEEDDTEAQTELSVEKRDVVDSSQGNNYQFQDSTGSLNGGISGGNTAQNSGIQAGNTASVSGAVVANAKAAPAGAGPANTLDQLKDEKTEDGQEITPTPKLFFKNGENLIDIRAVGVGDDKLLGVKFSADGISNDEAVIPVSETLDSDYKKVNLTAGGVSGKVTGNLVVKPVNSDETNLIPLEFNIDSEAPVIGKQYPADISKLASNAVVSNFSILTNTIAWIEISDKDSGMDSNFIIELNGNLLTPGQFDYNYGNNRLNINMDKIIPFKQRQPVQIKFLRIADTVGNEITNLTWNFIYDLKYDNTPPAKPDGVAVNITNKKVEVTWISNSEKDLLGYNIYKVGLDFSQRVQINNDIVPTNSFVFTANSLQKIGVSAMDTSSNESELSIVPAEFEYQSYPPKIFIDGVPEKTNGNVTAKISFMDDGFLIYTNITLDRIPVKLSWSNSLKSGSNSTESNSGYNSQDTNSALSNSAPNSIASNSGGYDSQGYDSYGILTVEESRKHELYVEVWDDDTNIVSNKVIFEIDKKAPDMPASLNWTNTGRNICLFWASSGIDSNSMTSNVQTSNVIISNAGASNAQVSNTNSTDQGSLGMYDPDSKLVNYNVYSGDKIVASNINQTNYIYEAEDYGRYYLAVSALDSLGNESAKQYVIADTEKGIILNFTNVPTTGVSNTRRTNTAANISAGIYSGKLNISADIMVSTNRYSIIAVVLSNTNYCNAWNKDKAFSLDINYDISTVPDGNYFLSVSILSNNKPVSQESYTKASNSTTNIIIDNTAPEIYVITDCKTNQGNYFITKTNEIDVLVKDDNFDNVSGVYNSRKAITYSTNLIDIPLYEDLLDAEIEAYDIAGNKGSRRFTVVRDTTPPDIAIDSVDDYINGSISDENLKGFVIFTNGYNYYSSEFPAGGPICSTPNFTNWQLKIIAFDNAGNTNIFESNIIRSDQSETNSINFVYINGATNIYYSTSQLDVSYDGLIKGYREYTAFEGTNLLFSSGLVQQTNYIISGLESGKYKIKINGSDISGEKEVIVDTIPPSVKLNTSLKEGMALSEAYEVRDNNLQSIDAYLNNQKKPANIMLLKGTYELKVDGIDLAGNTNSMTGYIYVKKNDDSSDDSLTNQTNTNTNITNDTPRYYTADFGSSQKYFNKPLHLEINGSYMIVSFYTNGFKTPLKSNVLDKEGYYRIDVAAVNDNGDVYTNGMDAVLDFTPPVIKCPISNDQYYSTIPTITVKDTNLENYNVLIDWTDWSNSLLLMDGRHVLMVTAWDRAGNTNTYRADFYFDGTPPSIVTGIKEGCYYSSLPDVNVTDLFLLEKNVFIDGNSYNGETLANGLHSLYVYAADKAGNSNTYSANFYVDTTLPQISCPVVNGVYYSVMPQFQISDPNFTYTRVLLDGQPWEINSFVDEGEHMLEILAVNRAGNTNIYAADFFFDSIPPTIVCPIQDGGYYSNIPDIVAYDISLIGTTIFMDGQEWKKGNPLTDGSHSIKAVAQDLAGNVRKYEANFTLDTTPPSISTGIKEGGYYSVLPAISVSDINLKEKTLYLDGSSWAEKNGLSDGAHTLQIVGVDKAMNSNSVTIDFTFDTTPPSIMTAVKDGGIFSTLPDILIKDANLNSQKILVDTKDFSLNRSDDPVEEGSHSVSVYADDKAGNSSTISAKIIIDKTPPSVTINPAEGVFFQVKPAVTVEDAHLSNCQFYLNGNVYNTNDAITNEGDYELLVYAQDIAGNATSKTASFTIDQTKPLISFDNIRQDNSYFTNLIPLIGINDKNPGSIQMWLDNRDYDGSPVMTPGVHNLKVTATDKAGNWSSAVIRFNVNDKLPAVYLNGLDGTADYGRIFTSNETRLSVSISNGTEVESHIVVNGVENGRAVTLSEEGVYDIFAKAEASLNGNQYNIDTGAVKRLIIDKRGPRIALSGALDGTYYSNDISVRASASDYLKTGYIETVTNAAGAGGSRFNIINFADQDSGYETTQPMNLNRDYTLNVFARDVLGREASTNIFYVVDKTFPNINISNIGYNSVYSNEINYALKVTDEHLYSSYAKLVQKLRSSITTNNIPYNGIISVNGELLLDVYGIDKSGNVTETNVPFVLDTVYPVLNVYNYTSNMCVNNQYINSYTCDDYMDFYQIDVYTNEYPNSKYSNSLMIIYTNQIFQWGHPIGMTNASQSLEFLNANGEMDYMVRLAVEDIAHNLVVSNLFFSIDRTAPMITFSANFTNGLVTPDAHPGIYILEKHPDINEVYLDGVLTNSGPTNFIINVTNEMQGHNLTVKSTDRAGNTASATRIFSVDQTPPAVTISGAFNGEWSPTNKTITVNISDLNMESYSISDFLSKSIKYESVIIKSNMSGIETFLTTNEATHNLQVNASDYAWNRTTNNTIFYYIDKTPPVISNIDIINGFYYNWYPAPNIVTADQLPDSTPSISNIEVSTFISNTNTGVWNVINHYSNTASFDQVNITVNPNTNDFRSDGDYRIQSLGIDRAGNTSTTNVSFCVDTIPPYINIAGVYENECVNYNLSPRIITTDLHLDVSKCTNLVYFNGSLLQPKYGSSDTTFTLSAEGIYAITNTAMDLAKNHTNNSCKNITIDKTPPNLTITFDKIINGCLNSGGLNIDASDNLSGVSNMSWAMWYSGGYVVGSDSKNIPIELSYSTSLNIVSYCTKGEGYYAGWVTVYDKAGNSTMKRFDFYYDTNGPSISFSPASSGGWYKDDIHIYAGVSDTSGVKSITIAKNGNFVSVDPASASSFDFWIGGVNGNYTLSISASDSLDNPNSTTPQTYSFDKKVPFCHYKVTWDNINLTPGDYGSGLDHAVVTVYRADPTISFPNGIPNGVNLTFTHFDNIFGNGHPGTGVETYSGDKATYFWYYVPVNYTFGWGTPYIVESHTFYDSINVPFSSCYNEMYYNYRYSNTISSV